MSRVVVKSFVGAEIVINEKCIVSVTYFGREYRIKLIDGSDILLDNESGKKLWNRYISNAVMYK